MGCVCTAASSAGRGGDRSGPGAAVRTEQRDAVDLASDSGLTDDSIDHPIWVVLNFSTRSTGRP